MLKDFCRVCNSFDDGFIGLRFEDGKPIVTFPRGYRISEKDEDIRRDILHLLTILRKFSDSQEGAGKKMEESEYNLSFPLLAYQFIIYDFLSNGYYHEKDVEYCISDSGKINWKHTIQKVNPVIDGDNALYLDFVIRKSIVKSDIITKIHEYCVYESFGKLGWLYLNSSYVPPKPSIRFNKKMFISILNDALRNTFNNKKKMLLNSMITIINRANENADFPDISYGVNSFYHIWEKMIDYVYGEENKGDYFPHGHYTIIRNGKLVESSALIPDTIMKIGEKLFILDAKYYKYGILANPAFLPPTSSIHKQITYGDYALANKFADANKIFNAFIIPFKADDDEEEYIRFVSVGTGDWTEYDENTPNYKYVLVILLDMKHIMDTYSRHNLCEIDTMATFIEESIKKYERMFKYSAKRAQIYDYF